MDIFSESVWDWDVEGRCKRKGVRNLSVSTLRKLMPKSSNENKTSISNPGKYAGSIIKSGQDQLCTVVFRTHAGKGKNYFSEKIDYIKNEDKDTRSEGLTLGNSSKEMFLNNVGDNAYHIILSPDNVAVDLPEMANDFMTRLSKMTGKNYEWMGGVHRNTGKPHVHLYINGKDLTGKNLHFTVPMISYGMRKIASKLCTKQVGKIEVNKSFENLWAKVNLEKMTPMDRTIKRYVKDGVLLMDDVYKMPYGDMKLVTSRLDVLNSMGMCSAAASKVYFEDNWFDKLKSLGTFNTYAKGYSKLSENTKESYSQYQGGKAIVGKVVAIYKAGENGNHDNALVIENPKGYSYFVPVYSMEKINVKEGDGIALKSRKGKGRLSPVVHTLNTSQYKMALKNESVVNSYFD